MTQTRERPDAGSDHPTEGTDALASGLVVFAAVMLVIGGILNIFRGIMAIAEDDIFVNTPNYVFAFDVSSWGWIHLVLGALALLAGLALFRDALWARAVGVLLAGLLLLTCFLSLPYYPLWSIVLIAVYGFVIWALCVAPRERF
ncbi:hypothetical protein ABT112_01415 [Streptomyces sp. NPDC002055]|uniref:DUF7144 family membrane protein n=1 Tax=Streptomyces sp. NPDC002055 TaxID=3154534 RepID=UPI00331D5166